MFPTVPVNEGRSPRGWAGLRTRATGPPSIFRLEGSDAGKRSYGFLRKIGTGIYTCAGPTPNFSPAHAALRRNFSTKVVRPMPSRRAASFLFPLV